MHTHSMQKHKSDGQVLLLKVLHSSLVDHPLEQVARHTQLCVCVCVVCVVCVHACCVCYVVWYCAVCVCVCVGVCVGVCVCDKMSVSIGLCKHSMLL